MSKPDPKQLEQLDRALGSITLCLNICPTDTGASPEWFVSFGTLLGLVRDRGGLLGDIDVSMFYEDNLAEKMISNLAQFNWQLDNKIIHPDTRQPLYLGFVPVDRRMHGDTNLDLFFWIRVGDHYYHTYDYKMEKPKSGVPSEYYFKGCPKRILRGAAWHYQWPGMAHVLRLPHYYGTLLDFWYPGWFHRDKNFGPSKSERVAIVRHPKYLEDAKTMAPQIEKSTAEYERFVDGYLRTSRI